MTKQAEDVRRMAVLNAEANRRLSELWNTTEPNSYYPAEDEIACSLLNPSSGTTPRREATPRASNDFDAIKN